MDHPFAVLCLVLFVYAIYRRSSRFNLAQVPGPRPTSFLLGNLLELHQGHPGEVDLRWQRQYGNTIRLKGVLGENLLMISDPKAIQYIFAAPSYGFTRTPQLMATSLILQGRGISWAEGQAHKRQRKILNPGFNTQESRALFSVSSASADALCDKWMGLVMSNHNRQVVVDVPTWISRAALDVITEAAFGIRLNCLQDPESTLARVFDSMLLDVFGTPSVAQIFMEESLQYIPEEILEYCSKHSSNPRLRRIRENKEVTAAIAKDLMKEKADSLLEERGAQDILTLLVKTNMDAEAKHKMSDEELYAQMRTILLAGHESSAYTISWILYELARKPEIQCRLRTEIREKESAIQARDDSKFSFSDLEDMRYMSAIVKEGLRYYYAAPQLQRTAKEDSVIPLSRPITIKSGKTVQEISVPKGTRIVASISAYHWNKELWGEDADVFNPDRWLEGIAKDRKEYPVGIYNNLLSFAGGHHACLGWRFAVTEIQTLLVKIVSKFQISITEKAKRIRREKCLVVVPTVDGEKGIQLPLVISAAPDIDGRYD